MENIDKIVNDINFNEESIHNVKDSQESSVEFLSKFSTETIVAGLGSPEEMEISFLQEVYDGLQKYNYHKKKFEESNRILILTQKEDLEAEIKSLEIVIDKIPDKDIETKNFKTQYKNILTFKLQHINNLL